MKNNTLKNDYAAALKDSTLCCELTETQIEGHHDLSDLASKAGHASLRSCLNDGDLWGKTVREVAEMLIEESTDEA